MTRTWTNRYSMSLSYKALTVSLRGVQWAERLDQHVNYQVELSNVPRIVGGSEPVRDIGIDGADGIVVRTAG